MGRGGGVWELEKGSGLDRTRLYSVLADGSLVKESPSVARLDFSEEENILDFPVKLYDLN